MHIFIHGGYWHRFSKNEFSFVARAFQPAGAAVVVISYALIPTADMDELVRQCRAAVAWAYRNATSFGGDRERLTVSGHSAGGRLAAMLLATDWEAFAGLPADVVKAVSGFSGLYDLEPIRLCYLNDVLNLTPEVALRNSPVHLVPETPRPTLIAVGGDGGPEYYRQSADLVAAWRKQGVPCELMDMAGHNHFSIVAELERPDSQLSHAILARM